MTDAIQRMGIKYGRLGISTEARLIELRSAAVRSAAKSIKEKAIPDLVRCALGLGAAKGEFFETFREADPTFDVRPLDRESALLACTLAETVFDHGGSVAGKLSLCLTTAGCGGTRGNDFSVEVLPKADAYLTKVQSETTNPIVADRKYNKLPTALTTAVETLSQAAATNQFASLQPHVTTGIKELGIYAESNALAAAKSDSEILGYVRRLEEELRMQWWVMGGWSADAKRPFRDLPIAESAVRAATELYQKTGAIYGVFSAPALLDLVFMRGHSKAAEPIKLSAAMTSLDKQFRETFRNNSEKALDLFPVSAAMILSADSNDAPDWEPRFKRITAMDAEAEWQPLDLATQLYRERVLERIFPE